MIGASKNIPVTVPSPTLQSEANYGYNPFPNANNATVIDFATLKAQFLADEELMLALTGPDGEAGADGADGEKGDKGDSIIVMAGDPTDLLSSSIGDLYLNSTTGSLYQRSGITQAQFIAANLEGIVLTNSIWIKKGNLGSKIVFYPSHPYPIDFIEDLEDLPIDSIAINQATFAIYKRKANYVTIPLNQQATLPEDYSHGYWELTGYLKGANGTDGIDGENAFEVLSGTGHYFLSNSQIGKTLIIPSNSAITGINYNNVTQAGATTFLSLKFLTNGFVKEPVGGDPTVLHGEAGTHDFFVIENFNTLVAGQSLVKYPLKGADGEDGADGASNIEVLTGTGHYFLTNAQIGKTLVIPSNSAITGINYNNVTQAGVTTFLSLKFLTNGFVKEPVGGDPTVVHGEAGTHDFFVIENFNTLVAGQSLIKYPLNGADGEDGKSAFEVLTGNGLIYINNSHIGKTLIVPKNSAISGIALTNVTIEGSITVLVAKTIVQNVNPFSIYKYDNDTEIDQMANVTSNDYFIINNFSSPQSGYLFEKISLKGAAAPEAPEPYVIQNDNDNTGVHNLINYKSDILVSSMVSNPVIIKPDSAAFGGKIIKVHVSPYSTSEVQFLNASNALTLTVIPGQTVYVIYDGEPTYF